MYKRILIPGPESLGVVAYLYTQSSFINSTFINRLNAKYNINNLDILENEGYIESIPTTDKGVFGNPPKYFKPTQKLLQLEEDIVTDRKLNTLITNGLYLLNKCSFNHYANYSKINLNIPIGDIELPEFFKDVGYTLESYGREYKKKIEPCWNGDLRYNMYSIGHDDNFSGRHHNFFTHNKKIFRKYLFKDATEIDVAFCQPLLLADALIKIAPTTDFVQFMIREYQDIYSYLGKDRADGKAIFNSTIFGVSHPNRFKECFPDAYLYLKEFKMAKNGYFKQFAGSVLRTNKKLTLKTTDDSYNRAKSQGELHFKIVALKLQQREVEIMNKVWRRLKRAKVVFVPIHDSVVIDKKDGDITTSIFKQVWSEEIDSKFRVRIKEKAL